MTPQPILEPQPAPRKATGPTTPEGKDAVRLNALRHGLTGQTVLMPWEDQDVYQSHCAAILASLTPVGELETQCAQGVADDQWRLNRARAIDTNMFALGQFDYEPTTGHSQTDAALNSARAFRDNSKAFLNLSLYEQRINRSLEKNFARLEALQQTRRQQEQNRLLEAGMARAAEIQQRVVRAHAAAHPGTALAASRDDRPGLVPTEPLEAKANGHEFVYASAPAAPPSPENLTRKAA
jgi:hypothetical protein